MTMRKCKTILTVALLTLTMAVMAQKVKLESEDSEFNTARTVVVSQPNGGKGVILKTGEKSNIDNTRERPDIVFTLKTQNAGRYELFSTASTANPVYRKMMVSLDNGAPRGKAVIYPWRDLNNCKLQMLKADLNAGEHKIRVWLPDGVALDRLDVHLLKIPAIPPAVADYNPPIVPPSSHPRLLINQATLAAVRKNLTIGENKAIWELLKKNATESYESKPADIVGMDEKLLTRATQKAFLYLMEDDLAQGKEALKMICDYLSKVEFDNQLDICRKVGQVIYSAALVYDWCYALSTPEQKKLLCEHFMRLSEDMEIGWPPFKQPAINGHGNEAQISRDLLSMAVAIYDEDTLPYKLCSYRILEEVVPAHNYEYRSGRHNQGCSYGPYRFAWDMWSAWIFYRMSGNEIFSSALKKVPYFWIYMKTPDGGMLADGDDTNGQYPTQEYTFFLTYTFAADPVLKYEFERENGMAYARKDALLFLLLNDPALKAGSGLSTLPWTHYFGDPLGAMICRTGWSFNRFSADVVVEMKGAGVQFYNHQHTDAGAFQIYYRGMLAADLGLYLYYGTPYDMNFNKRSIAHNVMLAYDPKEKLPANTFNDGGQRVNRDYHFFSAPTSLKEIQSAEFNNGAILAHDFGPNRNAPLYSYLKTDLTAAYSKKISSYLRSFCFLNIGIEGCPAVLITFDRMITAAPDIKKYWQINSYNRPEIDKNKIIITNRRYATAGKLIVNALLPEAGNMEIVTSGGSDANTVFGRKLQSPYPAAVESKGWRTTISPKTPALEDLFLNVMVICDEKNEGIATEYFQGNEHLGVIVADRIVTFSKTGALLKTPFEVKIPSIHKEYQLLLNDLVSGEWSIKSKNGAIRYGAKIKDGAGNLFAILPQGEYLIAPGNVDGIAALPDYSAIKAVSSNIDSIGKVFLNQKVVAAPPVKRVDTALLLLPAENIFKAAGAAVTASGNQLKVKHGRQEIIFNENSVNCLLDGFSIEMPVKPVIENNVWYLPEYFVAGIIGCDVIAIPDDKSVWLSSKPENDCGIIKLESSHGNNQEKLYALFNEMQNKDYWAANGKDVWIKMYLFKPQNINGIGITWFRGASRQFSFIVETSMDGKTWEPGFSGKSSGRDSVMATYSFSPRQARLIRFKGFGSSQNDWNSIHNMKLFCQELTHGNQ